MAHPDPEARANAAGPWRPSCSARRPDTVYQSWTFDAGQLPRKAPASRLPALAAFLDTVHARVGPLDARAMLDRQIAYYAARPDSDSQGEAANGRLVRTGAVGTLRAANCLEALLVDAQAARFAMASHPTEFHALILERAAADRRQGWRAVAHLHNHPFLFASGGDIAGANAPILTDVQFWRSLRESLGVESARVTNGFATFDAPAAAFYQLHARR